MNLFKASVILISAIAILIVSIALDTATPVTPIVPDVPRTIDIKRTNVALTEHNTQRTPTDIPINSIMGVPDLPTGGGTVAKRKNRTGMIVAIVLSILVLVVLVGISKLVVNRNRPTDRRPIEVEQNGEVFNY
jgi:amino acid transporter